MNRPPLIEWQPHNGVGAAILDEQHRGIVSIINTFAFSLLNQNVEAVINSTFSMMDTYTRVHFWTEEALLQSMNYPELSGHKRIHRALLRESFSVANKSLLLSDPTIYLRFLKNWWMHHINEIDKKYTECIRQHEDA